MHYPSVYSDSATIYTALLFCQNSKERLKTSLAVWSSPPVQHATTSISIDKQTRVNMLERRLLASPYGSFEGSPDSVKALGMVLSASAICYIGMARVKGTSAEAIPLLRCRTYQFYSPQLPL